jgi:hypothetical protein
MMLISLLAIIVCGKVVKTESEVFVCACALFDFSIGD